MNYTLSNLCCVCGVEVPVNANDTRQGYCSDACWNKWLDERKDKFLLQPYIPLQITPVLSCSKPEPSDFAKKLMVAFGEATRDAVASHLRAGVSVPCRDANGKKFELRPEDLEWFLKLRM